MITDQTAAVLIKKDQHIVSTSNNLQGIIAIQNLTFI